jgi:hypothetical protein
MHTHIHTCTRATTHAHAHAALMHAPTHTCMHMPTQHSCTHPRTHACTCPCSTHAHAHAHMHAHARAALMHTPTHTCMHSLCYPQSSRGPPSYSCRLLLGLSRPLRRLLAVLLVSPRSHPPLQKRTTWNPRCAKKSGAWFYSLYLSIVTIWLLKPCLAHIFDRNA